jgi:integrase
MPATQNGSVIQRGKVWQARWFDADRKRRSKNFRTKSEGRTFLRDEIDRVELAIERKCLGLDGVPETPETVNELLDTFLANWGRTVDPATLDKVTRQLKRLRDTFGTRQPDTLRMAELEDWRHTLPVGSAHDLFRAARQAFAWGVARGLVKVDPTKGIKNPQRAKHERRQVSVFRNWTEIEALCAELTPVLRALVVTMVGCGLRPEEALGLHRSDVDWDARTLMIRRRYTKGVLKDGTKTASERVVPFGDRVEAALKSLPPRLDTMILFPAQRGGHWDLNQFRHWHWKPALRAAGLGQHRVYDLRHTFITWLLERNVPVSVVAEMAGTSIQMIDATYSRPTQQSVRLAALALDRAVGQ